MTPADDFDQRTDNDRVETTAMMTVSRIASICASGCPQLAPGTPENGPALTPKGPLVCVIAELTACLLANKPVARAPHIPPQAWTPNTSKAHRRIC